MLFCFLKVDWVITDIERYFEKDFRDLYQTSGGDLEKAFLTGYGDSGITVSYTHLTLPTTPYV